MLLEKSFRLPWQTQKFQEPHCSSPTYLQPTIFQEWQEHWNVIQKEILGAISSALKWQTAVLLCPEKFAFFHGDQRVNRFICCILSAVWMVDGNRDEHQWLAIDRVETLNNALDEWPNILAFLANLSFWEASRTYLLHSEFLFIQSM